MRSVDARQADATTLAALLRAQREALLAVHAALPDRVDLRAEWNLPRWERGHVAWFAERWTLRQPDRARGAAADPHLPLPPGRCRDDFFDSSAVPHSRRWQLPLPDAAATQALLDAQLDSTLATLAALAGQPPDDNALYAFRLALLHEAMHEEAARLLARALGIAQPAPARHAPGGELAVPAQRVVLGPTGPGFAFDNEQPARAVEVAAFRIDARVRRWSELLPWALHAYRDDRLWSPAGLAWRGARTRPDALAGEPDPEAPAEPLSAHEAEAWCRWAGRRLPREAEWCAAAAQPGFAWGEVWEWTAEAFAPYPGFAPHPYRDYSQPWFDGAHRLLKGASRFTPAVLVDARFRNFYRPERSDLVAGLRSVAGP
jgi:formylglycine-generating enzyme required for sulfatase activity